MATGTQLPLVTTEYCRERSPQLKKIKDRARQSGSEFKVKRDRNFYSKTILCCYFQTCSYIYLVVVLY